MPLTLPSSEKVLRFPTGEIDNGVLYDLLLEARDKRLAKKRVVRVIYLIRDPGVDHYGDRPDLRDPSTNEPHVYREYRVRVGTLRKWYAAENGAEFGSKEDIEFNRYK